MWVPGQSGQPAGPGCGVQTAGAQTSDTRSCPRSEPLLHSCPGRPELGLASVSSGPRPLRGLPDWGRTSWGLPWHVWDQEEN